MNLYPASYANIKTERSAKGLALMHVVQADGYTVFATCPTYGLRAEAKGADAADFAASLLALSRAVGSAQEAIGLSQTPTTSVVPQKPTASRAYAFSIDFTKRQTWWADAVKVIDETFVGTGLLTAFQLAHGTGSIANEAILDLTRGLITDDHLMVAPGDAVVGGYKPVVKIDGVVKASRKPYETTGGDWWIDFTTGLLTFAVAPALNAAITVTYYYVLATAGPVIRFGPPAGKKWTIDYAEAQVAKNASFDDCIIMQVFGYGGAVALSQQVRYENVGNILDYSYGSFVEYPPVSGANGRGSTQGSLLFRWEYLSPIVLRSSLYGGMQIKSWTENQRAFGGERMTIVFYALEEPE